ncbi:hypothetical protein [Helicobacter pylori]|uniref:hypothetical protein n=1 Tax=Helicobacter pylori TaxID=210 RepID=UPI00165CB9A6|nr:hypothetical protein [Helicobacter pylori]
MSSDFKNIFIGADNSKRTKSNLLITKKTLSIPIRYHLSLMLISRNIREAKSQLPLFKISVKILTNLYWLN